MVLSAGAAGGMVTVESLGVCLCKLGFERRDRERRRSRTDTEGIQCKGGKDEIIQGVVNVVRSKVSKE